MLHLRWYLRLLVLIRYLWVYKRIRDALRYEFTTIKYSDDVKLCLPFVTGNSHELRVSFRIDVTTALIHRSHENFASQLNLKGFGNNKNE